MQQVYIGPPLPIYHTGTVSKRATVAPQSTVTLVFKYLRAIQSIFVSNLTAPKPALSHATPGSYTIKIFQFMQEPQTPPDFDSTEGLFITFTDYWGYIPVHQLCDGGAAHVYVVIRNHSQTDTIAVTITGEG
ncbi:MAG: hypothetical protein QXT00_02350 [Ignisphaera sp.]